MTERVRQPKQPRQPSQTVSNALCNKYIFFRSEFETWTDEVKVKQILHICSIQVHFATQAVLDKLPQRPPSSQLSGSLFLQLTVDQLGVCIPLYNGNQVCTINRHHGDEIPLISQSQCQLFVAVHFSLLCTASSKSWAWPS